jgi:hypothetical protein
VDLEDFFQSTVPDDFELTFHSGTPATDANKLSSSVVSSSGTYFGAFYLSASQCYTATGRPLVVTINVCTIVSTPSQIETVTGSTLAGKVPVLTSGKGGFTYSDGSDEDDCEAPAGFTSLTEAGGTVNGLDAATGEHTITAPTEPGNYFYCIKVCGSNGLCTVSIHKVVVTEACPAGTVAPVTKTKD